MRLTVMTAVVAAVASLAIPAAASAAKGDGDSVTVMTRNLFLGADLGPAIEAADIGAAIDGAGVIWNELESTKFEERAVPLAAEIKKSKADLVGLQEVATWYQQIPSDGGAPPISPIGTPATDVRYDFLKLLRGELKAAGAKYEVVVNQAEFEGELPVDVDQNDSTGTGPLGAGVFGADFDARLVMHDVILARKGSGLKLGKEDSAHFETRYEPDIGGIVIPVDRGWASVEAKLEGKDETHKFRFVDTHLEAFGDTAIREAQAKELFAKGGPLKTRKQVILVGDLNSGVGRHNEPEKPGDDLAFKALQKFGMKDNGAVQSCCYTSLFDGTLTFDHTVDHVLTKPGMKTKRAYVTGDDPGERTPSGLWPSDHGGVVSTLLFP